MIKNAKKLLASLAVTMLLSTSIGHAQSINLRFNNYYTDYNRYNRGRYVVNYNNYSNKYLQNRFENMFVQFTPVYWEYNNNKDQETPKDSQEKDSNTGTNGTIGNNANSSIEMEVVRLVNIERQKEGLAPLSYSEELSRVARVKSQDMAQKNYFSHNSPTYGSPFDMMKSFGIKYRTAGENIAKGYSSAQSVVRGWMNSSGHRANILNPSFGKIGIGYINSNGTTYWTQMFTD